MFKEIVQAILGIVIPWIFTWITGLTPDFPLDVGSFTALVFWVIGLFWSGFKVQRAKLIYKGLLKGD